jgi:hypothetical protein
MSFGFDGFAAPPAVSVEVTTNAYRIAGTIRTPFQRVAEILNQLPSGHLSFEDATIVEHAGGAATRAATAIVAADEVLIMVASGLSDAARDDMHIEKRPIRVQVAIPPLRLAGTVHVTMGSRSIDGLLNVPDRFLPMTDVTVSSSAHPQLDASVPVLAFRRDRAQVLIVADDEDSDELLADVLDEGTARSWLGPGEEPAR